MTATVTRACPGPPCADRPPLRATRAGLLLSALLLGCSDFDPPAPAQGPAAAGDGEDAGTPGPGTPPPAQVRASDAPAPFIHAVFGPRYAIVPDGIDHALTVVDLDQGGGRELRVGQRPRRLAGLPGRDAAVVLDDVEPIAHLVEIGPPDTLLAVPVAAGANAILVDADAGYAVFHHDPLLQAPAHGEIAEGVVTVVQLQPPYSTRTIPVDPPADRMALASAPARLYLQRGNALSHVPLDGETREETALRLGTTSSTIRWAPGAHRAIAFHPGGDAIDVADLRAGVVERLWLADLPALGGGDLDAGVAMADARLGAAALSETGEHLVVALAQAPLLLDVPLPTGLSDPGTVAAWPTTGGTEEVYLSREGTVAALLQRVDDVSRLRVTALNDDPSAITVDLGLPPLDVAVGGARDDVLLTQEGGFTVVSRAAGVGRFHATAEGPWQHVWAGTSLFILARFDAGQHPDVGRLLPEDLTLTPLGLDSPARRVGARGEGATILVDQAHPDGRLTRVVVEDGTTATLTGFHVDERVEE